MYIMHMKSDMCVLLLFVVCLKCIFIMDFSAANPIILLHMLFGYNRAKRCRFPRANRHAIVWEFNGKQSGSVRIT